ncbi:hypothetical protein ACVLV4_001617 [Rathayibacter agropyri]|nr:hypothetical protein [Rathayibacter agropyri]
MRLTRGSSVVAVSMSSMLLLSGCLSSPDVNSDERPFINFVPNVAVLDEATETVHEPLDVYGPDLRGRQMLERASDLLTEDCVHRAGRALTLVNVLDYPPSSRWTVNYFGPWTKERASRTGLDRPYDALSEAHQKEADIPPETTSALRKCRDSARSDERNIFAERNPSESIYERGQSETWAWASHDPIWEKALGDLQGCMTAQGYTFDDSRGPTAPVIADAPDSEVGIRAALDEVECLSSTGAAQTFVDVVAAYQVGFIAENEAALVADKKDTDERVAFAQKVISEHGGH